MTLSTKSRPENFRANSCLPFVACLLGLFFLGHPSRVSGASRSEPPPKVVSLGDNTYSIDVESNNRFARKTAKLKAQAKEAAAQYCTSLGKQLKVVSLTDEKPFFGADFIKARIVFQALDAGDPDLKFEPKPEESKSNEDYYTELIRIDDLHKRGILTDDEYKAEKKKILSLYHVKK
jgi:hypothetical protein